MTEQKFTEAELLAAADKFKAAAGSWRAYGNIALALDCEKHAAMLTQAARAVAEVGELKRATQNLIDALPDTRKLLLAREDAAAILREKKEKQGGN